MTAPTGREARLQPRLIVHTGPGKGKSTAAFGTALRAWNQGWSIGVFQFVKSDRWRTGERAAFEALAEIHATTGRGGPVEWQTLGAGFTWLRGTDPDDHRALARAGWTYVAERLASETHRFYLLDEFTYPLARGWLDTDEVVATLRARPGTQHVVVTGRGAPQALLDAADLVSDIRDVKHPLAAGAKGQPGIEW